MAGQHRGRRGPCDRGGCWGPSLSTWVSACPGGYVCLSVFPDVGFYCLVATAHSLPTKSMNTWYFSGAAVMELLSFESLCLLKPLRPLPLIDHESQASFKQKEFSTSPQLPSFPSSHLSHPHPPHLSLPFCTFPFCPFKSSSH